MKRRIESLLEVTEYEREVDAEVEMRTPELGGAKLPCLAVILEHQGSQPLLIRRWEGLKNQDEIRTRDLLDLLVGKNG